MSYKLFLFSQKAIEPLLHPKSHQVMKYFQNTLQLYAQIGICNRFRSEQKLTKFQMGINICQNFNFNFSGFYASFRNMSILYESPKVAQV